MVGHWAVCKIAIFLTIASATQATVKVDIGIWLQPLISRNDSLIVLENNNPIVQFRCTSTPESYLTEWIYDDDNKSKNYDQRIRVEWRDRKFKTSIDEETYDYISWIQMQFNGKIVEEENMYCRSASNHSDFIKVTLVPNRNNDSEVFLTFQASSKGVAGPWYEDITSVAGGSRSSPIEFSLVEKDDSFYWKCASTEDGTPGQISFHTCLYSAAQCANTFRAVKKLGNRVNRLNPLTTSLDTNWSRMLNSEEINGVALCTIKNRAGQEIRRAVEYFVAPEPNNRITFANQSKYDLHFSWNELNARSDMIWINPIKSKYFRNETLKTACYVQKYGFSFDPVFIFSRENGTRVILERGFFENMGTLIWNKTVELNFSDYEPGKYMFQCVAPVWNTTEWVYKTKAIEILGDNPSTTAVAGGIGNNNAGAGPRNPNLNYSQKKHGKQQKQFRMPKAVKNQKDKNEETKY